MARDKVDEERLWIGRPAAGAEIVWSGYVTADFLFGIAESSGTNAANVGCNADCTSDCFEILKDAPTTRLFGTEPGTDGSR